MQDEQCIEQESISNVDGVDLQGETEFLEPTVDCETAEMLDDSSESDCVAAEGQEDDLTVENNSATESDKPEKLPLFAVISSLLFVSTKPLSAEQLAEAAACKPEQAEEALEELKSLFADPVHGFSLHQIAGAWQFRTAPAAAGAIHRLVPKHARKLSRAAAETLAVIAYKQPVQRAEIEAIRGVDALPTLKTLLDARLIRIVGREQSAGQPALYGTTKTFLEKFGLADLSELPTAKELAQFFDEPGEVEEEESPQPQQLALEDAENSEDADDVLVLEDSEQEIHT